VGICINTGNCILHTETSRTDNTNSHFFTTPTNLKLKAKLPLIILFIFKIGWDLGEKGVIDIFNL
jgi:hypothetical protein